MTLEELMKLCRKHGVMEINSASVNLDGDRLHTDVQFQPAAFSLKFFPPEGANTPDPSTTAKDESVCRCGHPHFAHMNDLCTMGCDVEKCAPPEEKQ